MESESSKEEVQIIDQSNTSELSDIKNVGLKDNVEERNPEREDEEEEEWLDVLGSGQLLKKILKKGEKDTRPQRSDICSVKYVGKFEDKVVDEGLVTINLGDAEVIQGLDFTLPLMDLGEEAEIIIGPRFAFGAEGRKPDIPPDATLHYSVTLISSEPEPLQETLPLQKRKEIGNRKKERGNYWFARNDNTLAIQCYRRALEYLDDHGLSSVEEGKPVTEDEIHSLLDDRIKVYNNLAIAQMRIKAFDTALQSVDNVLRCQPTNVKALFRKGRILAEKGETEEGISFFKKALTLEPDNLEAKNELNLLLAKQKEDIAQQRELYKKMLGTKKSGENKHSLPASDGRRWAVLAAGVGAVFSMIVAAYKWYKPV